MGSLATSPSAVSRFSKVHLNQSSSAEQWRVSIDVVSDVHHLPQNKQVDFGEASGPTHEYAICLVGVA